MIYLYHAIDAHRQQASGRVSSVGLMAMFVLEGTNETMMAAAAAAAAAASLAGEDDGQNHQPASPLMQAKYYHA